jgi:signal transduction histidine kinase
LNDDEREAAHCIRSSVRFIRALVDNLLDLERIESGLAKREKCDLALLASSAAEEVSLQAAQKNVKIVPTFTPGLPPILGDPTYLRQAIVNLLSNAVKYSPEGGRVRINVGWEGSGSLVVSVADKGPGIPPEALPRLFERFYRVPGQEKQTGTGLGLAIVKSVAQAHGGRAWVESQLGKGSVFYLSFPIPPETQTAERPVRHAPEPALPPNPRVDRLPPDKKVHKAGARAHRKRTTPAGALVEQVLA